MKTHFKNRLLKLASFLEELPRKRFDFSTFVGAGWKGKQNLSCGTTACAFGWAASMPEFRRLGLRFRTDCAEPAEALREGYSLHGGVGLSSDKYASEEDAAGVVFGLNSNEFTSLFIPGNKEDGYSGLSDDATPKAVAKNIRKFVAKQE